MKVSDVMTRRVVTVRPDTPVRDAVRLMLQNDMSGLPVVDNDGALVGIVTEGDFLRRAEVDTHRRHRRWVEIILGPRELADEYVQAHAKKVGEVMTGDVVTAGLDTPLDEIVSTMERRRIKRIPIVRGEKLVGLVSRANILRAFAAFPAAEVSCRSVGSDTTIRDRILAELDKQPWAPAARISVVVWDGIVHLWGSIADERQRKALVVLAENVPGVTEVRDHLVMVEPISTLIS